MIPLKENNLWNDKFCKVVNTGVLAESTNTNKLEQPHSTLMDGKIAKDPIFKEGTLDTFYLSPSDTSKGFTC